MKKMPVAIPQTVRRALGEEAVVDFMPWMESWLAESIQEKAVPRDEYREVLAGLDGLEKDLSLVKEEQARMRAEFREDQAQMRAEFREDLGELRREMHERFAHIEERFDRVNERFDGMNQRLDQMNQHFESRLDQMSERMLVQTRWLIGTIALFGTILTIMMAIAQFTP
jgi:tetrahydromethanopterin S-methyltransferase subunit G